MQCDLKLNNSDKNKDLLKICGDLNPFMLESFKNSLIHTLNITFELIQRTNHYGELSYSIDFDHALVVSIDESRFVFSQPKLLKTDFFDLIDEDIMSFIDKEGNSQNMSEEHIKQVLDHKIETTYPIESLFYRILNESEKGLPFGDKDLKKDMLFRIVMEKNKVKDMTIVKEFINDFYEAKYAEILLTYYSLDDYMYEKALKDNNLSKEMKIKIETAIEKLPDHRGVIQSKNIAEIENYYFKMFENVYFQENTSNIVIDMLNNGFVSEKMMYDILDKYEHEFVLHHILRQRNCPIALFRKALDNDVYYETIIQNDFTPKDILKELVVNKMSFNSRGILERACEHKNADLELKNILEFRNQFLVDLGVSLSSISHVNEHNIVEFLTKLKQTLFNENIKVFPDEIVSILNKIRDYQGGVLIAGCNSLFAEVREIASNREDQALLRMRTRTNQLGNDDITKIAQLDHQTLSNILEIIPNNDVADEILLNLMNSVKSMTKGIGQKLSILKKNENINYDKLKVVGQYKKDFITYVGKLQEANNEEAIITITNQLVANNNSIEDGTISFNQEEMTNIISVLDKMNNKTITDNIILLKQRGA